MAPTYRSIASATAAATSVSVNAPSGVQATDFQLLIACLASTNDSIPSPPSGWTQVGTFDNTATNTSRVYFFTATGPTAAVSVTKSTTGVARLARVAYRDHNGMLPGSLAAVSYTTSGTGAAIPSTSVTVADSFVLAGSLWDGASNGASATSTAPGGWSERYDASTGSPEYLCLTLADTWSQNTGTVTGSFTWSAASSSRMAWALVLRPATYVTSGSSSTAVSAAGAAAGAKALGTSTPAPTQAVHGVSGRKGLARAVTTATGVTTTAARIFKAVTAASAASSVTGTKNVPTARTTIARALSGRVAGRTGAGASTTATAASSGWALLRHTSTGAHVTTEPGVRNLPGAYIGGGSLRMPPRYDTGDLVEYVPPTTGDLRYIVQTIRTGAIRNWDLPLTDVTVTFTLSGPCILNGKITGESPEPKAAGLDAWESYIHVEVNGIIRASVIVQPLSFSEGDLEVEGIGFSAYPEGIPFMSAISALKIDAAEIVRRIWAHIQSYPDADLNVTVDPINTGRLLGEPSYYEYEYDQFGYFVYQNVGFALPTGTNYDATRIVIYKGSTPAVAWDWLVSGGYPFFGAGPNAEMYPTVTDLIYSKVSVGWLVETSHPKLRFVEEKPYVLNWFDDKDCANEITTLAKQVPFDYVEEVKWNAAKTEVDRFLGIKFPRAGRKRTDLRFAEDENLLQVVVARETVDQYASVVILRGAGSGRDAVRGYAATRTNRMRRVAIVNDKRVLDSRTANALANDELRRRMAVIGVEEIVIDGAHPNAPLGSFELGDDILIEADMPYIGRLSLFHRITAYTWSPDSDAIRIEVRRSDQWAYGRLES